MDERGEIHSLMPCAPCGMERTLIQALNAVIYRQYLILLQTALRALDWYKQTFPIFFVIKDWVPIQDLNVEKHTNLLIRTV